MGYSESFLGVFLIELLNASSARVTLGGHGRPGPWAVGRSRADAARGVPPVGTACQSPPPPEPIPTSPRLGRRSLSISNTARRWNGNAGE